MGFAAGFGEGFANSWAQAAAASNQRKEDIFKLAYENYMTNKQQYLIDQRNDQKAIQESKDLVSSIPGVPPDAWKYAYTWARQGMNVNDIRSNLATSNFPDLSSASGASTAAPTGATSVSDQMNASGLGGG